MTYTNLKSLCLAITMLAILPLSDAFSQDFIMQTAGATYNATAGGVIRMKNAASSFENTGALNTLGTTSGDAIEGIVDWASTVGQDVQGLYYTNMVISGGVNKNILTGVYITGLVNATPPTGYADFATYPFYITAAQVGFTNTFAGTFNYIGTTQNIFPVTTNDAYVNLVMDNATGAYTMPTLTVTSVTGTIALTATSTLAVNGELNTALASSLDGDVTMSGLVAAVSEIQVGAGAITFAGDLNVGDYSTVNAGAGGIITTGATLIDGTTALVNTEAGNIAFNGDVDVTEGSIDSDVAGDGTVTVGTGATLALTATAGELNFGPLTDLEITGAMSNAGDGTNLNFEATSTVTYNSAVAGQSIVPTLDVAGNRYGNLVLSDEGKVGGTASYTTNINVETDFSLADGDLDMVTNSGYVNLQTASATNVTYAGDVEVVGGFRRQLAGAALTTEYLFNNNKTSMTFADLPESGDYYQLFVNKNASPYDYVAATDVDRKITASYDLAGIVYTLKAGYLATENPTYPTVPDGLEEDNLKFFESIVTPASEKVAGNGYTRDVTGAMHSLSLAGLIDGTADVDGVIEKVIKSGNDLVLRASNTMFSIVDGRWSNPNVWDEGRIPAAEDNIEVRTVVYVGIDGPFANTSGGTDDVATNNTKDEFEDYGSNPAANKITIANLANSSLIIGNEDNGATYVHKTGFNGTSFLNKNTNAIAVAFPMPAKGSVTSPAGLNGLWLNGYGGVNPAILRTMALQNEGAVNNESIIEIGE